MVAIVMKYTKLLIGKVNNLQCLHVLSSCYVAMRLWQPYVATNKI